MKFVQGRQGTGYLKYTVFSKPLKLGNLVGADCHILKYPPGSSIPPHVDKVDSGKHYRLNVVLKKSKAGGIFSGKALVNLRQRFILFRPDKEIHSVSEVLGSERILLSVGWVLK